MHTATKLRRTNPGTVDGGMIFFEFVLKSEIPYDDKVSFLVQNARVLLRLALSFFLQTHNKA